MKQLKFELAALDRKIQLELVPPRQETAEKQENVQENKPTVATSEPHSISDRIIIARPGVKFRPA